MTTTEKTPETPLLGTVPEGDGPDATAVLPADGTIDKALDKASARRATAEGMATRQRDISVSEFFTKNRHLLGFDNPAKALLTTIKEAVDNALDACEEAGILPSLEVSIEEVSDGRYRVRVEDNGPGIVKEQIPKIFAKLLYGSKFHRLRQSRGQQGIGISAAGMYGQLTTGKPVVVVSKIGKGRPAWRLEVRIDSRTNTPEVLNKDTNTTVPWEKDHGTAVEIELTGLYRAGRTSVDAYLEQTVVANPHLELTYKPPRGNPVHFPRVAEELPPEAQEIKPHPHGVELGMLLKIFQEAGSRSVRQTMIEEFSRVTGPVADEICRRAMVPPGTLATRLTGEQSEAIHGVMVSSHAQLPPQKRFAARMGQSNSSIKDELLDEGTGFSAGLAEAVVRTAGMEPTLKAKLATPTQVDKLYEALRAVQVKILPPPATCVVPVGEPLIDKGLSRRFAAELIVSHTRPPAVYRGNPFVVEAGIAFGGALSRDSSAEVLRFANRVPLLYQPRACAITEAVLKVDWKSYGLQQRKGELPVGPLAIFVHLASVWVPFTSEAKEAVAHYDEIVREIRMALMECGRKLGAWVKAQQAEKWEAERKSLFEKYIAELSVSIHAITGVPEARVKDDFYAALPNHVRIAGPKDKSLDSVPPTEGGEPGEGEGPVGAAEVATEASAPGDDDAEVETPTPREEPVKVAAKPRAPRVMSADEDESVQLGFGPAFEDVTPNQSRRVNAPRAVEAAPKRVTVSARKAKGGAA